MMKHLLMVLSTFLLFQSSFSALAQSQLNIAAPQHFSTLPINPAIQTQGLQGTWQGTLDAGGTKLRVVLTVTKSDAGAYSGKLDSLDQGAIIPIDTITVNGDAVRIEIKSPAIVYEGTLNKERTELTGTPGLSDLPIIGRLFATHRKQAQQTDIVLTLTPHIVRVLDLSESDLRPFKLGRDSGGSGAAELPNIQLPPRDRDDFLAPPPTAAPGQPGLPFPQPLQGTLPGGVSPPPKKPGGGGGAIPNH